MKRISLLIMNLSALLLLGSACDSGGGGGGGGAGTISGLDADLVLAEIPAAEQVAGCEKLRAYYLDELSAPYQHTKCLGAGIDAAFAAMTAPCQETYDACLSGPGLLDDVDVSFCGTGDASCQATVGEMEACMQDHMESLLTSMDLFAPYSCSNLVEFFAMMEEMGDMPEPEEPACAAEMEAKGCDF
jgi:hypothetical protein